MVRREDGRYSLRISSSKVCFRALTYRVLHVRSRTSPPLSVYFLFSIILLFLKHKTERIENRIFYREGGGVGWRSRITMNDERWRAG